MPLHSTRTLAKRRDILITKEWLSALDTRGLDLNMTSKLCIAIQAMAVAGVLCAGAFSTTVFGAGAFSVANAPAAQITVDRDPAEARDVTEFANTVFRERVNAVIKSLYCKALSCELVIERVRAAKTSDQTFLVSGGGYLRWTIPGVGTSVRRSLSLAASYTRGTCVVKDVKTISDVSENNNGWGASRLQNALAGLAVPANVILEPQDCAKVDQIIWQG